jgi:methyl-accepting chemotaxis protein
MKNIKIAIRLAMSYAIIVVMTILLAVYLLSDLSEVNKGVANLYEKAVLPLSNTTQTSQDVQNMLVIAYQTALTKSNEERLALIDVSDSIAEAILKIYNDEKTRMFNEEGQRAIDSVLEAIRDYNESLNLWITEINSRKGRAIAAAITIPDELFEKTDKIIQYNRDFVTSKIKNAEEINKNSIDMYAQARYDSTLYIILIVIITLAFNVYIAFSIIRPLNKVVATLKKGESGDMRARTQIKQKDEIGVVASSIDDFFGKMQDILNALHVNSDTLSSSSEELSSISRVLASGSEQTINQSEAVASATEQMSVNISAMATASEEASVNANQVAASAKRMSSNINTVAAAIEEMSTSINQIADNADNTRKITAEATIKSKEATDAMDKLGVAAKEIGKVTEVIKKIADKTNLLALNATIEAAGAGEAGKGFAVVANAINDLANQSIKNTEDIATRIEDIQQSTNNAINVIHDICEIITKINSSIEGIAGHIVHQTKASNEIAQNVAQANTETKHVAHSISEIARGSNDASRNASEVAKGATHVSGNIVNMSQIAKETAQGALQIRHSSGDLAKIVGEFSSIVGAFKV